MTECLYPKICSKASDIDLKKYILWQFIIKQYNKKYPNVRFGIVNLDDKLYIIVYIWSTAYPSKVTDTKEAKEIAKQIAAEYDFSYKEYADSRKEFCGYILYSDNIDSIEALLKIKNN